MGTDASSLGQRRSSLHGHWSSRAAFILAVTGSAVGLGNIWKFPYITGENGGGAFVLLYLGCVFAVGMPIMVSEVLLGRRGRRNPIATMAILGQEEGGSRHWRLVGTLGVVAGLLILSFYSVIAGWSLAYAVKSAAGSFAGTDARSAAIEFFTFTSNWQILLVWHAVFMAMTVFVVAAGVQHGLERAVRVLMPLLVVMLLVLVVYSARYGAFEETLAYLFKPDFAELSGESMLIALGHCFFTLSIGMGVVMAYGAYLPEGTSIAASSLLVVLADTVIALLAGMAVFPLVFGNGLNPAEGPGLVFETLPIAFGQLPAGAVFGTVFFLLLTFAAWTSAIGLLEPAVAWIVERFQRSRVVGAVVVGGLTWLLGLASVLSFNVLSDLRFGRGTLFHNIDFLASNILLPASALLITVFAGWIMCRNSSSEELAMGSGRLYKGWRLLSRVVAPLAIVVIAFRAVGVI